MKSKKEKIKRVLDEFIPSLLCSPDELNKYLGSLKYFHKYSLRNLIIAQQDYYSKYGKMAEGYWSTYKQFQNMNRQVQKGQKSSVMIRPQQKKFAVKNDKGEEEERFKTYYVPFSVFDVSQTEGEEIGQDVKELYSGVSSLSEDEIFNYVEQYYKINKTDTKIKRGSTDGKEINISYNDNTSVNSRINTLIHELAHNKLNHFERKISREAAEVEAETTAYIITTLLNIENKKSRLYVAGWGSDDTKKILKKSSGKILSVAEEIVKDLNKLYGVDL